MENVIKQGILRKAFPSDRGLTGLLDKIDPNKWFVFLVRDGKPFLEYYDKQTDVFSSEPVNSFDLSTCKQVTFTFLRHARVHTFNIVLEERVIELATTSRDVMISWCDCIENTLQRLGIYRKDDHDHVYSFCPAVVNKSCTKSEEDQKPDSDEEEEAEAAATYSVPDEYIFGTFEDMDNKREKLKDEEGKNKLDLPLCRKVSSTSMTSDQDDTSDYSGDFVGRDFFIKNRVLPGDKKTDSLGRLVKADRQSFAGVVTVTLPKTEDSNNNSFNAEGKNVDDLDDGYSELANLKKDSQFLGQNGTAASSGASGPSAPRVSRSSHIKNRASCSDDLSKEKLMVNLPEASCNATETCVKSVSTNGACASGGAQATRNSNSTSSSNSASSSNNQRTENLYSDFPGSTDEVSGTSSRLTETSHMTVLPETSVKTVDPIAMRPVVPSLELRPIPKKRSNLPHSVSHDPAAARPFSNWETFDNDVPVPPPITSIPPLRAPPKSQKNLEKGAATNGAGSIPPLPPRFDSLPTWGSVSMDETALKQNQDRPMRRVPSPNLSQSIHETSASSEPIPPLPPRRDSKRGQKSSSTSDIPPPLPARKSQSFRIQRPITSPPNLIDNQNDSNDVAPRRPDRQLSMRMRVERGQSAHTVISLKHNQVDILMGEILSAGVAREISQKACQGLALVDVDKKVWIGGWNWKDYPSLHSKFHVGDEVLSINGTPVEMAQSAMKMLKHATGNVEVVVRRIPHAKVFEIRRDAEGQSLGIKREGGTGEILYVDPNGLAAVNGLPSRAESVLIPGFVCNWFFTEINSRPVSLFFKELEIEHRLSAVGLELSYVLHPSDFIFEIKKQLQKKIKNYKSYLPY